MTPTFDIEEQIAFDRLCDGLTPKQKELIYLYGEDRFRSGYDCGYDVARDIHQERWT